MAAEVDEQEFTSALAAYARACEGSGATLVTAWTAIVEVIGPDGKKYLRHWTSDETPEWLVRGMLDTAVGELGSGWDEDDA